MNRFDIYDYGINSHQKQMKLVIDKGHWATRNNEMIFGNIVWLCVRKDVYIYHLIDDEHNEIKLKKPITDYIVEEKEIAPDI